MKRLKNLLLLLTICMFWLQGATIQAKKIALSHAKKRVHTYITNYVNRTKAAVPAVKIRDYKRQATQLIKQKTDNGMVPTIHLRVIEDDFAAFIKAEYPINVKRKPKKKRCTKKRKRCRPVHAKTRQKPRRKKYNNRKKRHNKGKRVILHYSMRGHVLVKKKAPAKRSYRNYKRRNRKLSGHKYQTYQRTKKVNPSNITISYAQIKVRRYISKAGVDKHKRLKLFNQIMLEVHKESREGRIARTKLKQIAKRHIRLHEAYKQRASYKKKHAPMKTNMQKF